MWLIKVFFFYANRLTIWNNPRNSPVWRTLAHPALTLTSDINRSLETGGQGWVSLLLFAASLCLQLFLPPPLTRSHVYRSETTLLVATVPHKRSPPLLTQHHFDDIYDMQCNRFLEVHFLGAKLLVPPEYQSKTTIYLSFSSSRYHIPVKNTSWYVVNHLPINTVTTIETFIYKKNIYYKIKHRICKKEIRSTFVVSSFKRSASCWGVRPLFDPVSLWRWSHFTRRLDSWQEMCYRHGGWHSVSSFCFAILTQADVHPWIGHRLVGVVVIGQEFLPELALVVKV